MRQGGIGVVANLHWQLDFTFRDDKNTSTAKTGAKNLQIIKKIVLSMLDIESIKHVLESKGKSTEK